APRLAVQLGLLSALAFAAQGLLPLDPARLLAPASRLHATAWTLWWVAFVPAALLLAVVPPRGRSGCRACGGLLALLLPACALFGALLVPAALAQRIAFALWFAWWLLVARDRAPGVPAP